MGPKKQEFWPKIYILVVFVNKGQLNSQKLHMIKKMFPKSNVSKDNFNKKKATIFLLKYKIYYKSKILALFDELSFFNCIQRVE